MQRASEWRNGMSRRALEVVEDHFNSESMTPTEVAGFASSQVGRGLPFLSVSTVFDPKSGLPVSWSSCSSPLIAHHPCSTDT